MLPLAHAGGIDELLIIAVPVALYLLYLGARWWEGRRGHRDHDRS